LSNREDENFSELFSTGAWGLFQEKEKQKKVKKKLSELLIFAPSYLSSL
jgi:hypothetical protein